MSENVSDDCETDLHRLEPSGDSSTDIDSFEFEMVQQMILENAQLEEKLQPIRRFISLLIRLPTSGAMRLLALFRQHSRNRDDIRTDMDQQSILIVQIRTALRDFDREQQNTDFSNSGL